MPPAGLFPYKGSGKAGPMILRRLLRRGVTLAATYAVALNVIFLGLAPFAAKANPADPFSIICHSLAGGDEAPAKSGLVPGKACEHCNLCGATEPPPAPEIAYAVDTAPPRLLRILIPVSMPDRGSVTAGPHLARGPPPRA
jgi:hypothetical protein